MLNIILESCVPLLKYAIADHHYELISLQVTHKTFVSHIESNSIEFEYPIMSSIIRYSEAKAYTHQYPRDRSPSGIRLRHIYTFIGIHHRYNDIVYVHFLALCCCKYVTDRVSLMLHLGVQKHRTK